MSKASRLEDLQAAISGDKQLPLGESNLVFGEGSPDAEVMFIGEAPGFHEDQQKRPFVGRAGKLLDQLIEEIGWRRQDTYITNVIKRRPPGNRDPLPQEIEAYRPYLEKQIEIIQPKVIVPLGRYSMAHFVPDGKISRDQGKIFRWKRFLIVPLYHPAAALRKSDLLSDIREGFAKLPNLMASYPQLIEKYPVPREKEEDKKQTELFPA